MTEPQNPSPPDDVWKDFNAVEAAKGEQLDRDYQLIERYNATLLNQIAGIEDVEYEFAGTLSGRDGDAVPDPGLFRSPHPWAQLYLQPDREDDFFAQGEDPKLGDPYVIRGEVPKRTERLLDELLTSVEAQKDEELSSPAIELWSGNVAGEPITITKHHQVERAIVGDKETQSPVLTVIVSNPNRSGGGFIERARQAAEAYKKPQDDKEQDDQESKTTEARRRPTGSARRWIFPKRREF